MRDLTNAELETLILLLDEVAANGRGNLRANRDKLGLVVVVEISKLCAAAELLRDSARDDLRNRRG